MQQDIKLLADISVAFPCLASWDEMRGDDRKRYCDGCKMHVYNLSAMPESSAEQLLKSHEGRICIRFEKLPDGKIVTEDTRAREPRNSAVVFRQCAAFASLVLLLWSTASRSGRAMQRHFPTGRAAARAATGRLAHLKHNAHGVQLRSGALMTPPASNGPARLRSLDRSPFTGVSTIDRSHHRTTENQKAPENGDTLMAGKTDSYVKRDGRTRNAKPLAASAGIVTMGVYVRF